MTAFEIPNAVHVRLSPYNDHVYDPRTTRSKGLFIFNPSVMKIAIYACLLASVAVFGAYAAAPNKAIVVSYPNDTPDSVLSEAKAAIKAAVSSLFRSDHTREFYLIPSQGGIITHEYNLIKAFAAKAPPQALDTVQTMGSQYNAVIEEDQMVTVDGGL